MSGLLSVTSALLRARQRELEERKGRTDVEAEARRLEARVQDFHLDGERSAELLVEPIRSTGHGNTNRGLHGRSLGFRRGGRRPPPG